MVQSDTATPTTARAKTEAPSVMALINKRYPERSGLIRRIHPVWGSCFRINFHDVEKRNYISESHFVSVVNGELTEMN